MPELPEVDQAAKLVRLIGQGRIIQDVQCIEDRLVFDGITCQEFTNEIQGRTLLDAKRYGKYFYLILEGPGRMPVLHLGMTGYLQLNTLFDCRDVCSRSKKKVDTTTWPPKFTKFVLQFATPSSEEVKEVAYSDARRLGRVKLRSSPLTEPPISSLGFDPLLSLPTLDEYMLKVTKRKCPIKALLLDQSFNAGVGNWVADEILFHSGIHPERRCHTLNSDEVGMLYDNTIYVCRTAVELEADSQKFPSHWLFKYRWNKGKRKDNTILLSSGKMAEVTWVTVGGRTSAVVVDAQPLTNLNKTTAFKKKTQQEKYSKNRDPESPLSELSETE